MFQGTGADAVHSYGANVGAITGPMASVAIDSGFHNGTGGEIVQFLKKRKTEHSSQYLVNTHYHSDHTFGNSVVARSMATVIAQQKTRHEMVKQSARLLETYRNRNVELRKLLQGVKIHLPNMTFKNKLALYNDDSSKIELIYPGFRAHTDGDVLVNVIDERVVYAGDILWTNYHPNIEDGTIDGMIRALKMIVRLRPRRIVPGHGPVSSISDVKRSMIYFMELDRNIRKALRKNLHGKELYRMAIPKWSWNWKMRWVMESYLDNLAKKTNE
jgi:glyoxylase-like metal-dependent hydrolase (beta-lactamase superfamily II)